jgi:hypothetical protein
MLPLQNSFEFGRDPKETALKKKDPRTPLVLRDVSDLLQAGITAYVY